MSDFASSREPEPAWSRSGAPVGARRLTPFLPRRHHPWLLVEVDDTPGGHRALIWALREAARREATVLAVSVLGDDDARSEPGSRGDRGPSRAAALERLDAQLLLAIGETGIHGRSQTAVLERPVFDALNAAAHGADLVVVGNSGKTVLRAAVPRSPTRRALRAP